MPTAEKELRIGKLSPRQVSALKRKAERMGISPGDYVRQLIEEDFALDAKAQTSPLSELAAPFRKALRGASEEEISGIVNKARRRQR